MFKSTADYCPITFSIVTKDGDPIASADAGVFKSKSAFTMDPKTLEVTIDLAAFYTAEGDNKL